MAAVDRRSECAGCDGESSRHRGVHRRGWPCGAHSGPCPARGIGVIVSEMRAAGEPPSVRCNQVSARTMEIFDRRGIVRAVREAGLPADDPNDVAFRTTATGIESGRIAIPRRAERHTAKGALDTWWPTSEPPHRINQIYFEPVLSACASPRPKLRILNRTMGVDFEQTDHGALAVAGDLDTDERREILARYTIRWR